MDTAFAEHLDNENRMLGGLSPSVRRQLARLLRKLEISILDAAALGGSVSGHRTDCMIKIEYG
ncbi:hypothetical protein ABT001_08710 [Streptomyces sp. NPDC002793]|uniref:hypothetical protein n=1 Tax=Streptomyces sp. NPDC002793 TaxID=3154432 RepID=UPI0033221A47